MQPSDDSLLKGCREGKKESWDAFVERYSKLIYWSIHRTLESSPFAARAGVVDDLFQEIFVKILEPGELGRIRDSQAVAKYLSVLSARKTLDKIRVLAREETPTIEVETQSAGGGDAQVLCDEAEADIIRGVLEDLKPNERFCLEMHYVEGKTHREIALLTGISQDTVSTLIRRTREKLKEKLSKRGF